MSNLSLRRAVSIVGLACTSLLGSSTLASQSLLAAQPTEIIEQSNYNKNADPFYQEVRTELEDMLGPMAGEDYYMLYRIIERISRANGLDDQPWRIRVTSNDVPNAYASNLNMMTFEGGMLDQIDGDMAAIACIVGHEMAHHTEEHGSKRVEIAAQLEALQVAALEDARAEIESASRQANIFSAVVGVVAGAVVPRARTYNGFLTRRAAVGVLDGLNQEQAGQAAARAEEIYEERLAELSEDLSAVSREHETEADTLGYQYIVRAGFDPTGCARAMDVLNGTLTSRLPGLTHPKPADRVAALSAMNTPANNQPLISQGEANLSRSPKPLEYGFGREGTSLRIESRFGSQDIDDSFPQ